MRAVLLAVFAATWISPAFAQGRGAASPSQPPPTQPQPQRPRAVPAARPSPPRVTVRDQSGTGVPGAKLMLTGAASAEFTTDESGSATLTNLKDGSYRLRCEREGFVTLEREFVVRGSQPSAIDVTLNRAPAPPPAPVMPAPPSAPKPAAPSPIPPSGPPVSLSIPEFVDKNFIGGREPLKESVLACNGLETVRLLQVRDPVAEHNHSNMDEVLYVVAGEGTIRLGTQPTSVAAGSLSVVPHGTPHALERRGRNPLILLSTLAGAPCPAAK
jgi:mannose-6-phosphate isomerase-like protein (cupin superfamily)